MVSDAFFDCLARLQDPSVEDDFNYDIQIAIEKSVADTNTFRLPKVDDSFFQLLDQQQGLTALQYECFTGTGWEFANAEAFFRYMRQGGGESRNQDMIQLAEDHHQCLGNPVYYKHYIDYARDYLGRQYAPQYIRYQVTTYEDPFFDCLDQPPPLPLPTPRDHYVERVSGDGNCLFRAVTRNIYGNCITESEEDYLQHKLRLEVCDYMLEHWPRFAEFARFKSTLRERVQEMRKTKTYADHLEVQAISELLDIQIIVLSGRSKGPWKLELSDSFCGPSEFMYLQLQDVHYNPIMPNDVQSRCTDGYFVRPSPGRNLIRDHAINQSCASGRKQECEQNLLDDLFRTVV